MDMGMMGLQKQFISHPLHYFLDSCSFLSDNTISIKCVLLRMWTPSTLLSIHSSKPDGNLRATYSFAMFTPFYNITQQNINTCITISTFVNYCKTKRGCGYGCGNN